MKVEFKVLFNQRESASLNRPAWTSEQSTGMFNAYKHKHTVERGRFKLIRNHWR